MSTFSGNELIIHDLFMTKCVGFNVICVCFWYECAFIQCLMNSHQTKCLWPSHTSDYGILCSWRSSDVFPILTVDHI